MLRTPSCRALRILRYHSAANAFSTSALNSSSHLNAPLDLDPALHALLKDVDISLANHKGSHQRSTRELEALPPTSLLGELEEDTFVTENAGMEESHSSERKSPAAMFGSRRIGAVTIPLELQNAITEVILASDKPQLHSDAKRLFYDGEAGGTSESQWETQYDTKYRSKRQAARHAERDGTAFASIALPAHYSSIYSVLDHVKRRLESTWRIQRVVDWGTGTGSGLWASLHAFQRPLESIEESTSSEPELARSDVLSYLGIDKREGLVSIGKRLLRSKSHELIFLCILSHFPVDAKPGRATFSWQKSYQDKDRINRSEGHDVLALSAFLLSSLPTPVARKTLIKEMWNSGAHTIVSKVYRFRSQIDVPQIVIDHGTPAGFAAVAEAREYLLSVGRKETDDPTAEHWNIRGSHVIAPCPHDLACPLHSSTKAVCHFSQRFQRPAFVRLTKHNGLGHEDINYSYVVIRRGSRPAAITQNLGRVGEVGRRAANKEATAKTPLKELFEHDERHTPQRDHEEVLEPTTTTESSEESVSEAELQESLRQESFKWPRLVFPPLKRSGHVILDSCTVEGKIMRLTVPKSQGKQPYYDARKSAWGDLFPHEPKNAPQERFQPQHEGGATAQDARSGKRNGADKKGANYEDLSKELKEKRKMERRERVKIVDSKLLH